ncbi:MAG TPA: hypothetical protein VI819_02050 [Patescibacteria group bacterium]|nr:hypothetical protein [Patescibacteria group bacterium]
MKKILLSAFSIGVVAIGAVLATGAFFSDEETSTGNTFVAGAIDLLIDNESYAIDWNIPGYERPIGAFVASKNTSWELADLTVQKFFDFVDLKPGDYGEDTISVHVNNNDAWVCAAARLTDDNDNTYTEPETGDDLTVGADPLLEDGELDEEVNFVFWWDDGDNVYEIGENGPESVFLSGPLSGMGDSGQIALADQSTGNPLPGGETVHIGKYWCFGTLARNPVAQDGQGKLEGATNGPLARGTGFTCDGEPVDNAAQTDIVVGDLQFYAVQHRNNPNFLCSDWKPTWPVEPTRISRTQDGFGDGGWAGWSCPAGTHVVGGGIDSSLNLVGGNGMAKPGALAVDGFNYPVYPHYTFPAGETGYVVHDLVDSLGNSITFHLDCAPN